jgi:alkanesulfonate monooxygenase SsuD/methylene tetrahydromethanopterin reductase-like flavin-dependent oxidoreductase (luciferase family)
MHVGMCLPFMNHGGVDDHELMRGELVLGDLAEPLGFDSLWCFEHHFTSYMLSPNPLQILTYFAGRTQRIQLGTMVVVLPWHHPVRVAEEVLLLDHVSRGRTLLGVGRGIGRIEYERLGVDQSDSKALSTELIRCLTSTLESGICEYDGEHVRQAKVQLRPRPFQSFRDRIFIGAGSPETSPMCAELGVGIIIIPQKAPELHRKDVDAYREAYAKLGRTAPAPVFQGMYFVDDDPVRAREEGRYQFDLHYDAIIDHYEFRGTHMADNKDNKAYAALQKLIATPEGEKAWKDQLFPMNPVGTPKQVRDQILDQREMLGADRFVGGPRYGSMSMAEAERNLRLFAEKVLPDLKNE